MTKDGVKWEQGWEELVLPPKKNPLRECAGLKTSLLKHLLGFPKALSFPLGPFRPLPLPPGPAQRWVGLRFLRVLWNSCGWCGSSVVAECAGDVVPLAGS